MNRLALTLSVICLPFALTACETMGDITTSVGKPIRNVAKAPTRSSAVTADVVVWNSHYDPTLRRVILQVRPAGAMATGENIVDSSSKTGVANYVAAKFPTRFVRQVTLLYPGHKTLYSVSQSPVSPQVFAPKRKIALPPPGVTMDPTVRPLAGINAYPQTKFRAILSVALSKLGTPYIWGHNEDRGEYGFDCSNFTSYVYHHALGYTMSGASQVQYHSVGVPIAKKYMKPGDLIVFADGAHVGIDVDQNKMIEEGGGLGKVGYLSIAPGSYWGNHITVIKRMF